MARRASGFVARVADGDNTAHQLREYLFVFRDIDMKRVEGSSALIRRAHQLHPLGISPWRRARPTELSRPNRRWAPGRGSGVVGYNVQVAVDTKHHLIVTHEVTNVGNYRSQLAGVA